jgi:2-polyprenyl-3-methyl-5-hydroxy-6-metoxy-1,4-benzoquinol methylase
VYAQLRSALGDLNGKRVLEYGCGEGWITYDLARLGATVCAFDISPVAVNHTQATLSSAGLLERCTIEVMPAERLSYADESFDTAVGFAIVHHLDVPRAFAELFRVLKPGGVAYFAEPLATNPLIQAYRRLTPQYRTADERPMVLRELPQLLAQFRSFEHREYYLTALGAIALSYLPGCSRYFPRVSAALHRVDRALLAAAPALGNWAWYSIFKITK